MNRKLSTMAYAGCEDPIMADIKIS